MVLFMFLIGLELDSGPCARAAAPPCRPATSASSSPSPSGRPWPWPCSTLRAAGYPLHRLRALPRRGHERHRLPRAGADPRRARDARTPLGTLATSRRRRGRRDGVDDPRRDHGLVPARAPRRPRRPARRVSRSSWSSRPVRRPLRRAIIGAFERRGRLTHGLVAMLVALGLAGACVTEAVGVHALFGAPRGPVPPPSGGSREAARERLEDPLVVVLLPLFFAFTGLRTRLDLLVDVGAPGAGLSPSSRGRRWASSAVGARGADRAACPGARRSRSAPS